MSDGALVDESRLSYRKNDVAQQDQIHASQVARASGLWGLPVHDAPFAPGDRVQLRPFPAWAKHKELRLHGRGLPAGGVVSKVVGMVHAGHPQHIEVDGVLASGYWYEKIES